MKKGKKAFIRVSVTSISDSYALDGWNAIACIET
jgi:hypothetical protein